MYIYFNKWMRVQESESSSSSREVLDWREERRCDVLTTWSILRHFFKKSHMHWVNTILRNREHAMVKRKWQHKSIPGWDYQKGSVAKAPHLNYKCALGSKVNSHVVLYTGFFLAWFKNSDGSFSTVPFNLYPWFGFICLLLHEFIIMGTL